MINLHFNSSFRKCHGLITFAELVNMPKGLWILPRDVQSLPEEDRSLRTKRFWKRSPPSKSAVRAASSTRRMRRHALAGGTLKQRQESKEDGQLSLSPKHRKGRHFVLCRPYHNFCSDSCLPGPFSEVDEGMLKRKATAAARMQELGVTPALVSFFFLLFLDNFLILVRCCRMYIIA